MSNAAHVLAVSHVESTTTAVFFWVLAVVSVAAALVMVLVPRAVYSALSLAVVMLSLAVLYAVAGAPFLAFVQVIVYTGAVLMLFLFVLMIVGVSSADSMRETIHGQRMAAGLAGIGLLVLLSLVVGHAVISPASPPKSGYGASNVPGIATLIFTRYVFPFEVTGALLITAALGAMVLAHRERARPKLTQRELSRQRVASGHPTPLPGPGSYARHNAVDMPALLPDGTVSELSVSPVIAARAAVRTAEGRPPPEALPPPPGGGAGNGTEGGGTEGGGRADIGTAGTPGTANGTADEDDGQEDGGS